MTQDTIEKVKRVACDYHNPEKTNASRILAKKGIFIDIAGIEWKPSQLVVFGKEKCEFLFGFDPISLKLNQK